MILYPLLGILLISYINLFDMNDPYIPKEERIANLIMEKNAEKAQKNYPLICIGNGSSMPGGPIRKLILSFSSKRTLNKNEIRKILVEIAQQFVIDVNNNEDVQKYLFYKPFSIENVDVSIVNKDQNGKDVFDPEISIAEISQKVLTYRTEDPSLPFGYKNIYEETYEEALRILQTDNTN